MKLSEIKYEETCILFESEIMEMARVQKSNSGIPVMIYVSTKDAVKSRHGPRIKVSNIGNTFSEHDNFAIDISKHPRIVAGNVGVKKEIVEDIFDWVSLNYEPLIEYWNNEYLNDSDFYAGIKPVTPTGIKTNKD